MYIVVFLCFLLVFLPLSLLQLALSLVVRRHHPPAPDPLIHIYRELCSEGLFYHLLEYDQ